MYPTDKHGALIVPQEVKNLSQGHYRKISCRRDHQNESEYKFDFAWAKENCDDAHFVATAKKGTKVVITICLRAAGYAAAWLAAQNVSHPRFRLAQTHRIQCIARDNLGRSFRQ